MPDQWLRKISLIVGNATKGLELEQLHIKFNVMHRTVQTQSTLTARLYNPADATVKMIRDEFKRIVLMAGYSNETGEVFGVIFQGSIINVRDGRENPTDTYLDITAWDGDRPYNWGVVNHTLAAGHSYSDVRKAISGAFAEQGANDGYHGPLPTVNTPRGRAMFGMARDYARALAKSTGHTWGIKSGQYETVPLQGTLPDGPIVVNSHTGMIGLPQQTADGIIVRTLLNPNLWHNKVVRIDNKSIQKVAFPTPVSREAFVNYKVLQQISISRDGMYKVLAVDHTGDTRGQTWYSDFWCISTEQGSAGLSTSIINMNVGPDGPLDSHATQTIPSPAQPSTTAPSTLPSDDNIAAPLPPGSPGTEAETGVPTIVTSPPAESTSTPGNVTPATGLVVN